MVTFRSTVSRYAWMVAAAITMAATISGCDDKPTEPDTITGSYTLRTVNGKPLPTFGGDGSGPEVVVSSIININENGTMTSTLQFRETASAPVMTFDFDGTWTLSGNLVTFSTGPDGDPEVFLWSGSTLTSQSSLIPWVFTK